MSGPVKIVSVILPLVFLQACVPQEVENICETIRKECKAEDVNFHKVEDTDGNGKELKIIELIVVNSPILAGKHFDYLQCHEIARKFHKVYKAQHEYDGIRVVITSKNELFGNVTFTKNYYYGKELLW